VGTMAAVGVSAAVVADAVVGGDVAVTAAVGTGDAGFVPIRARTAKKAPSDSSTTAPAIRAIHRHGGPGGSR